VTVPSVPWKVLSSAVLGRSCWTDMVNMISLERRKQWLIAVLTAAVSVGSLMADENRPQDSGVPAQAQPTSVAETPKRVDFSAGATSIGLPKNLDSGVTGAVNPPVVSAPSAQQGHQSSLVESETTQDDKSANADQKSLRKAGVVRTSARLGSKIGSQTGRVIGAIAGGTVGVAIKLGSIAVP